MMEPHRPAAITLLNVRTPPVPTAHDVARAEKIIDDLLSALPLTCTTGTELFSCITKAIGYGTADASLKAIAHRLQKHLERAR